jgi:hypothetical protein
MALVFVAFMDTSDPTVKAIAFTLAAGVFLDAFLVRLVLVPALLAIGGTLMWHSPAWLQRYVPDPDIEGARLPAIKPRPGGQGATPGDDAGAEVPPPRAPAPAAPQARPRAAASPAAPPSVSTCRRSAPVRSARVVLITGRAIGVPD